jgi:hypothetical protein
VYAGTAEEDEVNQYRELGQLLTSSLHSRVTEVTARLEQEQ